MSTTPNPGGAVPAVAGGAVFTDQGDTALMHADAVGNNSTSNSPHENMAPYQAVNFIIALVGIYPSRT